MKQKATSQVDGKVEYTGPEIDGQTVVGTPPLIVIGSTLFADIIHLSLKASGILQKIPH